MATHSSILAWRIPWTEEPGGLQFMGSQRVGHDWVTNTFTFHFHIPDKSERVRNLRHYPICTLRKIRWWIEKLINTHSHKHTSRNTRSWSESKGKKETKQKLFYLLTECLMQLLNTAWGYVMRGKCSVNIQSGLHHRRGTSNLWILKFIWVQTHLLLPSGVKRKSLSFILKCKQISS